jgi:hypothetical protein
MEMGTADLRFSHVCANRYISIRYSSFPRRENMKPYLYILAVLLVGGGIGYFIGIKSVAIEQSITNSARPQDDSQLLLKILERQTEAYKLHDELLLLRDCASNYSEINGNSGATLDLQKTILFYHEQFKEGKSISFVSRNPEIKISKNSALIKALYAKTSDMYEKLEIKGYAGEGVWLLSKSNGTWQINSFAYVEEAKK